MAQHSKPPLPIAMPRLSSMASMGIRPTMGAMGYVGYPSRIGNSPFALFNDGRVQRNKHGGGQNVKKDLNNKTWCYNYSESKHKL